MPTITIKELHQTTGEAVRKAGRSRTPLIVTDHGKPIAVIANPDLLKVQKRKHTFLPAFKALIMSKKPGNDVMEDLDAIRGDR